MFSEAGISADPEKIKNLISVGRPETIEDIRSFLQAASYNAKFAFDH